MSSNPVPRIFVVDDERVIASTLAAILQMNGFSAKFFTCPLDALANCNTSERLANALLYAGSNGIIYPSVRHSSGTCIACFRPALVFHPRRGQEYRITLGPETGATSFEQVNHPL